MPEAFVGKVVDLQSSSQALALALTETGQITCWNLFTRTLLYRTNVPTLAEAPAYRLNLEEQGGLTLNFPDNRTIAYNPNTEEWKEVAEKATLPASSFEQLWQALPCELPPTPQIPESSLSEMERLLDCLRKQALTAEYTHLLPSYIQRLQEAQDLPRLNALVVHLNRSNCLSGAVRAAVAPLLGGLKQSLSPLSR